MVTAVDSLAVSVGSIDDLDRIVQMWWTLLEDQQSLDWRGEMEILTRNFNESRVERFLENRLRLGRILTAMKDGELVGICSISPDGFLLEGSHIVWVIADVFVGEHCRRCGVATALVKAAENECVKNGADEVRLTVYVMNDAARGLYQSLGYELVSHEYGRRLTSD
jgi:ribosomal protein S18 acetylase RimI-like enzyme